MAANPKGLNSAASGDIPPPVVQAGLKTKGGRSLQLDSNFVAPSAVSSLLHASSGSNGKRDYAYDIHSGTQVPVFYQRADERTPLVSPCKSSSDHREVRTVAWSAIVLVLFWLGGVSVMFFLYLTAWMAPVDSKDGDHRVAVAAFGLFVMLLSFLTVFYVLYYCVCGRKCVV